MPPDEEFRSYRDTLDRESSSRENQQRPVSSRESGIFRAVKYAAAGAGALFLGYKALGREGTIELLSNIGTYGYKARDFARGATNQAENLYLRGLKSEAPELAGASKFYVPPTFSRNSGRAVPDLVTDLRGIFNKFKGIPNNRAFTTEVPGHGTVADLHRNYLKNKFSAQAGDRLRPLTVNDILESTVYHSAIDPRARELLGRARSLNIVSGDMAVSKNGLFGHYVNRSGRLVESQWASPRNLFDSAYSFLSQFQIAGFKPADIAAGVLRPLFWEGEHQTIGNNITLPNGFRTPRSGMSFNLGRDIYSTFRKSSKEGGQVAFRKVASNVRIYDLEAPGGKFWARALAARYGDLAKEMDQSLAARMKKRSTHPIGNFWQRVQQAAGVGPEFQTEKSFFSQIIDFYKRSKLPESSWRRYPNVEKGSTLNWFEEAAQRIHLERMGVDTDEYFKRGVPNKKGFKDLSFFERLQAYAGKSKEGTFLDPKGNVFGQANVKRSPTQGFTTGPKPNWVGPAGELTDQIPASGGVGERGFGEVGSVFMHHATDRLNSLLGATTGFGFRPTPGKYGWLGNLAKLYGLTIATWTGIEYLKYADYLAGKTLSILPGLDDTRPSQYAVKAYTKAQVLRQQFRELIGIQQTAEYSEGLMPGSFSLPGSWVARTLAPPAIGAYKGKTGLALGLAASFLFGGSDVEMPSEDLANIYSGAKEVAYRPSRWWVLGGQPWKGDKISHFQPHWAARYQSDYRYTNSQYGSEGEYFRYASPALTPHNLFGILPLLNPNHYANKHYYTRPYPYSSTLSSMHEGEDLSPPYDPSSDIAEALGYNPTPKVYPVGSNPGNVGSIFSRAVDYVSELGGAYKFLLENTPGYSAFTGGKASDVYSADASLITSKSRELYDENLGGLLGMTEYLRRFLDPSHGKQGFNRVPNTMPSWLPGARSEFKGDRDYYVDFTLGDPYARIPQGEARLPGAGYEALHALQSGTPGVYSDYDRYKILADVAPYSTAYRAYKGKIQKMVESGGLEQPWVSDYYETEKQVKAVTQGPEHTPRRFTGVRSGSLEELASVNKYSLPERVIGGGWEVLTHDVVPAVGRIVPLYGSILDRKILGQRSAYESYLEDEVYGKDFQDWATPYSSFIRPRIQNLVGSDPVTGALGGAGLATLMGPTPVGVAVGLFGAGAIGAASTARMISTGRLRGGWIPNNTQEENETEEYFDSLAFLRAKRNAELAKNVGRTDLVPRFALEASRTAVGAPYDSEGYSFQEVASQRMGQSLKGYARTFINAPEESRERILEVAPEMARPLLESAWAKQGDKRYNRKPDIDAMSRAREIVSSRGMPPEDWPGWSPDIPMETIKIKTMDSQRNRAYDMHRHNLWSYDRMIADRGYSANMAAY